MHLCSSKYFQDCYKIDKWNFFIFLFNNVVYVIYGVGYYSNKFI